jgi:hypothetical protein
MKYLLILLLFSCKSYPVHEANLIQQQKTMQQFDQKSRSDQQKIRSGRENKKKLVKRTKNKYI